MPNLTQIVPDMNTLCSLISQDTPLFQANSFIDGFFPLSKESIFEINHLLIAGILIDSIHNETVAFLGTNRGILKKVYIIAFTSGIGK